MIQVWSGGHTCTKFIVNLCDRMVQFLQTNRAIFIIVYTVPPWDVPLPLPLNSCSSPTPRNHAVCDLQTKPAATYAFEVFPSIQQQKQQAFLGNYNQVIV